MAIIGPDGEVRCAGIEDIATIVVIYAENRSFDTLYGSFPSANGLSQIIAARYAQPNRDGSILRELPRCGMLAAKSVVAVVTQLDRIALRLKRVRRPHLVCDTTSILRSTTKRGMLPILADLMACDAAVAADGSPAGDLTNALDFLSQ